MRILLIAAALVVASNAYADVTYTCGRHSEFVITLSMESMMANVTSGFTGMVDEYEVIETPRELRLVSYQDNDFHMSLNKSNGWLRLYDFHGEETALPHTAMLCRK